MHVYQYLILGCADKAFSTKCMLDNNNNSINTIMKKYHFNRLKATFEYLLKSGKQFA